jgi:carbamoyltransferase
LRSDHLGRRYRPSEIDAAIDAHTGLVHRVPVADAAATAAREVADGLVVGWFEGASELGPRALGHRSILADPRGASMRDHLNATVKFREPFRPYAASVLSEHAATFFEAGDHSDPFMLTVSPVRPGRAAEIASVCHVDGTCRLQCVDADMAGQFRRLIEQFYELTGVPLVLNTSFNVRGEPMVETPTDAIQCFLASGIDVLYLDGQKLAKHRLHDSDSPGRLVPHPNALLALTHERRAAQGGWEAETATARTRTGYAIALDLSEAALLARVDGKMSVEALTQGEPNALAALERLGRKGLVAFAGSNPPRPRRGVSGTLGGPRRRHATGAQMVAGSGN